MLSSQDQELLAVAVHEASRRFDEKVRKHIKAPPGFFFTANFEAVLKRTPSLSHLVSKWTYLTSEQDAHYLLLQLTTVRHLGGQQWQLL